VTVSSLTLSDRRHGQWHDHPCLPELIRKSQAKLSMIDFSCLDFSSSNNNNDMKRKDELMSALGACIILYRWSIMLCNFSATDFISCLGNKQSLKVLSLHSVSGLSSASIRAIATQCPNLEWLTLYTVSGVSDQELSVIINGCRKLESLDLTKVNITDQSMRLLVETNRDKEIVSWESCPLVTWEGNLFYVRELSLIQLLSEDVKQQSRGIRNITSMIPHSSPFPIEQFISLGVFSRLQTLLRTKREGESSDERDMNILSLLCRLVMSSLGTRYVAVLIEIGFIESILALDFTKELVLHQWLEFFVRISEDPTHDHYLLSIGILPRLVTVGQVTRTATELSLSHLVAAHHLGPNRHKRVAGNSHNQNHCSLIH
jgi:hypothetical protein